jgi:heat shock protein HtpX
MVTLSIVLSVLGITGYYTPTGIDYSALMAFCFVWGMAGAFISLAISRIVARHAMGVQLIDGRTGHEEVDRLYSSVRRLTEQAGLPMPQVGVYESPEVNAFATGPTRRRSLVAVSTGLLRTMRPEEVEGVLAHEVAHIQNGDMVTMTLIQGVVNAFVLFFSRVIAGLVRQAVDRRIADLAAFLTMIVLDIAFGILGAMVVAGFSRAREFRADAGGAALAGRSTMIAALQRLARTTELVDKSQPSLATLKIAGGKGFMALLATHPPLPARIEALQRG